MRNNFDCSSSGVNVEVDICFDTYLSQINFHDNFKKAQDNNNVLIYTDYGNIATDVDTLSEIKTSGKKWVKVESRGYSQGDFVIVIVLLDDIIKQWGSDVDLENIRQVINHILWDTLLRCRIIVNGTEYIIDKYDEKYVNFYEIVDNIRENIILDVISQVPADIDKTLLRQELETTIPYEIEY